MRFLADVMLKKAGRWMRMLGYDVEFPEGEDDEVVLGQAERNGLVLLTMDEELHARARRRGLRSFLVTTARNARQVAQIMREFGLTIGKFPSRTRCVACNGGLRKAGKEEVKGKVPAKSYAAHDEFWMCEKCGQVFWEGSHWGRIEKGVEEIRRELGRGKKAKSD